MTTGKRNEFGKAAQAALVPHVANAARTCPRVSYLCVAPGSDRERKALPLGTDSVLAWQSRGLFLQAGYLSSPSQNEDKESKVGCLDPLSLRCWRKSRKRYGAPWLP